MDEINLSKQEFKICEAVRLGLTHYYLNNSRDKRFVTPAERAWAVATLPKLPERWWSRKYPWMKPVCK